jgi:hypothetical protein
MDYSQLNIVKTLDKLDQNSAYKAKNDSINFVDDQNHQQLLAIISQNSNGIQKKLQLNLESLQ